MSSNLHNLSLREMKVEQLRVLATEHTGLDDEQIAAANKLKLMSALAEAAGTDGKLARKLKKADIALKPSFYLMSVTDLVGTLATPRSLKTRLERAFSSLNSELVTVSSSPVVQNFSVEYVDHDGSDSAEFQMTWERSHTYWSPEVKLANVYELRFGFAILDFKELKAIVACHTESERDVIAKAVKQAYGVILSPLTLTKALLNQIGTFDKVKRASYFIDAKDPTVPENVSYSDEQLGAIPIVRQEEDSARSIRQQSFYRITVGDSVVEQGVGATSSSGKLWVPRETPLNSIRDFGIGLLGKISETIHELGRKGEVEQVATVMNISRLPEIDSITPVSLREAVCDLVVQLANMLLKKEKERNFTPPVSFATSAVPKLFNPPSILLTDEAKGDTARWVDKDGQHLVTVKDDKGDIDVTSFTGAKLKLEKLVHPLTGAEIEITNTFSNLQLLQTPALQTAVEAGVGMIANHIPKLSGLACVPFRITQGKILLDVKRAFGQSTINLLDTEVKPHDVRSLQKAMKSSAPPRDATLKELRELGEKCGHMTDDNCRTCLTENNYLCLRSLVARFFANPLILGHKCIELSDGQFEGNVGGQDVKMFSFAKMAPTARGTLTARNDNGAILLSQVIGQVDKTAFQVATIVAPSPVNEDLRERLALICGLFGKKLLVLDYPALALMWQEFQVHMAPFDGLDVAQMLRDSKKTGSRKKAAKKTSLKKNAPKRAGKS